MSTSPAPAIAADPIAALIERFEDSIVYDCHSLQSAYRRSDWRKELVGKGRNALSAIHQHLATVRDRIEVDGHPALAENLRLAWRWLLGEMFSDDEHAPKPDADLRHWMAWVESQVPTPAAA